MPKVRGELYKKFKYRLYKDPIGSFCLLFEGAIFLVVLLSVCMTPHDWRFSAVVLSCVHIVFANFYMEINYSSKKLIKNSPLSAEFLLCGNVLKGTESL